MSQNAPKRIALLLGQDLGHCRRVFSGILNFVEAHQLNWIFHDAPPEVKVLPALRSWQPDGVFAHLYDRALAERLIELQLPLVSTTDTLMGISMPLVDVDNFAVGEMAADYFLSRGYRTFAYYGNRYAAFSCNRESGFRSRLGQAGYTVSNLHADFLPRSSLQRNWNHMDSDSADWLRSLDKPVAIFASNDIPARALTRVCRVVGFRIPEDVAILGADNDHSECRLATPPLSSVELPAERVGYSAAEMMCELLEGRSPPEKQIYLMPRGVIVRDSTDLESSLSPHVMKALRYMEHVADRAIKVPDVAKAVGCSRRVLERRFHDEMQYTVHDGIQLARVNHAKRLLLETEIPIKQIVEKCGLASLRQLDRLFQKYVDCSPSKFRACR